MNLRGFRDVVREAFGSLDRKPGRAVLCALGALLGVAILTAAICVTASASQQVAGQFNLLRTTRLTVTNPTNPSWLRPVGLQRTVGLSGVTAVAVETQSADQVAMQRVMLDTDSVVPSTIVAADASGFGALGATVMGGRLYDAGMLRRKEQVVVLGQALAASLGISLFDGSVLVHIAAREFSVIGVVGVGRQADPSVLLNAYIPDQGLLPELTWQSPKVVLNTLPEWTNTVATYAPVALAPDMVGGLVVEVPPDPQGLRSAVSGELQVLLKILGLVSLTIGVVVIATAALSSVGQRRVEIAVRRALGTSRIGIYGQIVLETMITGGLGGLVGSYIGQLAVAGIAASNGWPVVGDLRLIPAGLALGVLVGGVAGIYPAGSAARAEPADALRG